MDMADDSTIRRLKSWMEGSSIDKDRAESKLKDCAPCTLPDDILEVWATGSSYDKFRAGRIKELWAKQEPLTS